MNKVRLAAFVYAIVNVGVIAFQLALAAGVPWGEFAMGGAYPGQFPPELRVAAVVQAVILALLALIVLARAGVALPGWSRMARWAIWFVVAFSVLSLILNSITPSIRERAIWAPVALVMVICSVTVARSK
jgi:cell shape-determining protein MreD